ncbi:mannosyl-oligosaccharide 1,2-alpha-mannosidase IA [Frankliniella occidentalis]|uniref:alpha-1,2-Mannosidase n=1 Tax=Frankliniella occidentalis TaxID=133901 RepID=A0A9C6XUF9_FRAOC|nr:mannosyl-oligosaccharide 1,2-alpha-mannosidase IA [Frankliniella occidentalis]
MAAAAAAPLLPSFHQRFAHANGAPGALGSVTRRSFRPKERFLILLVFGTFALVCFGAFFYLPEYSGAGPAHRVYGKVLESVQKAGPDLLMPAAALENPGLVRHDGGPEASARHLDPHSAGDRAKLLAKMKEDAEMERLKNPKVLERPEMAVARPGVGSSAGPAGLRPSPAFPEGASPAPAHGGGAPRRVVTVPPRECEDSCPRTTGGEDPDPLVRQKRDKVKEMMRHAWDNYVRYAWGRNELRPVSRRAHSGSIFGNAALGATIVDGLDTLFMMGMMDDFTQGRNWVEDHLDVANMSIDVSVFETNIRFVGGLLTCYSLTGDVMFRDKAEHIAEKLLPAFQTPTGIPNALINLKTGFSKNYAWASGGSSILSEFGTLHLEFSYLSDVTGNHIYREKIDEIRRVLRSTAKPRGLYPNYLNPKTGKWGQQHISMGALGDSFYEYLLKAWIQSNQDDQEAREMFDEALSNMFIHMLKVSPGGLTYFADMKFESVEHKMDHLACFSGGLLALAAKTQKNEMTDQYRKAAAGITNTCHESYDRSAVKLGPEVFRFTESLEAKALRVSEKYYILRPEVIESYFVLWRTTHDQKYRDWAWEAVQAIEKHCRVPGGYTGLKNVYQDHPVKDDVQQSFFLAETLKYLYLIFSDDSFFSLDDWVLNTEAHPLPIKDRNPYYRGAEVRGDN